MARAARLSGSEPDDEDYEEFEEMLEQAESAQVRNVFSMTQTYYTIADSCCAVSFVGDEILYNFLKMFMNQVFMNHIVVQGTAKYLVKTVNSGVSCSSLLLSTFSGIPQHPVGVFFFCFFFSPDIKVLANPPLDTRLLEPVSFLIDLSDYLSVVVYCFWSCDHFFENPSLDFQ